jgi:hypothetical protein
MMDDFPDLTFVVFVVVCGLALIGTAYLIERIRERIERRRNTVASISMEVESPATRLEVAELERLWKLEASNANQR